MGMKFTTFSPVPSMIHRLPSCIRTFIEYSTPIHGVEQIRVQSGTGHLTTQTRGPAPQLRVAQHRRMKQPLQRETVDLH